MASAWQAGNTTKADSTYISGNSAGMEEWHPNQHTQAELEFIWNMRRHNPALDMIELWHRLKKMRLYPPPGESVPGYAKNGTVSG